MKLAPVFQTRVSGVPRPPETQKSIYRINRAFIAGEEEQERNK